MRLLLPTFPERHKFVTIFTLVNYDDVMRLPANLLTSLSAALQRPARPRPLPRDLWQSILKDGWGYRHQIEDLVLAMDHRVYDVRLDSLAKHAEYPVAWVSKPPRFPSSDPHLNKAMSSRDIAGFCIFLEFLGFALDLEPMVATLNEQVASLPMMTRSESDIFTYTHWRHKRSLCLKSEESLNGQLDESHWRSTSRYRYFCLSRGGQADMLTVTGPKWRPSRLEQVTCSVCEQPYVKGDLESVLNHRTHHARVVRLLSPKPSKRVRERLDVGPSGERVDVNAPLWLHREVYERAFRFKREFKYDFVQWHSVNTRADLDPRWIGFVFAAESGEIDGACAFRLGDDGWSLGWVWVRPERRRNGLLTARWPTFLAEFGDFWIEHPLSKAMHGFVARHASEGQKTLIESRYPDGSPIEQPGG